MCKTPLFILIFYHSLSVLSTKYERKILQLAKLVKISLKNIKNSCKIAETKYKTAKLFNLIVKNNSIDKYIISSIIAITD